MKFKAYFLVFVLILTLCAITNQANAQATRKVIFEKWTSSTCGPCASQNPSFEAWIPTYWDAATVVAYHVGWPTPGNDPMYLHNPTQSYDRRYYYGINAVPCARVDGVISTGACVSCSYTNPATCMTAYLNQRRAVSTPLAMTVTDLRIPGDSIRTTIVLTLLSNLPSGGSYFLRVMAVERIVSYTSPPGTNGETVFPDVFRASFPTSQGTSITTTAGTYNYVFTYKKSPVWVDSMIYTLAFVQNDVTKEVFNSGRPANITITGQPVYSNEVAGNFELMQNYPNPFNPSTYIAFTLPKDEYVTLKVYDVMGKEINTLVNGNHKAGTYNIFFDGSDLASGVYLYKLTAGDFTSTKKMLLVK